MLHAEGQKSRNPLLESRYLMGDRTTLLGLALRGIPVVASLFIGLWLVALAHGTPFVTVAGIGALSLIFLVAFLMHKFG